MRVQRLTEHGMYCRNTETVHVVRHNTASGIAQGTELKRHTVFPSPISSHRKPPRLIRGFLFDSFPAKTAQGETKRNVHNAVQQ